MHPNPTFRASPRAQNVAFARERGFGILAVNGPDGPLMSHVPFLLDDEGRAAGLHLVRSNPIAAVLRDGPVPARLAVSGPDGYVSPDWYEASDQVPTWNYVAVHLTGNLEQRPMSELRGLIDAQSGVFEERLAPKPPWRSAKMSEGAMTRMMRQIVPCRLNVAQIDGTWKLNQNKSGAVRLRAADQVATNGQGHEVARLARLMRTPPEGTQ